MTESDSLIDEPLRESEARYRAIFDYAPEAIVVLDVDSGKIVDANLLACSLFGRSREVLLECDPLDLAPETQPDGTTSVAAAGREIERAMRGEHPQFEWTYLNGSGEPAACEVRLAQVPDGARRLVHGSFVDIRSVARDITDERADAEAIARSEAQLRRALETAGMGTWRYDIATDRMEYSEQAARIYGRSLDEMPKTMREALRLFHPDDIGPARARVRGREPMPETAREYRIRLPNGDYRWMGGVGELQDPDGHSISGLIVDIHERKLAEGALKESEERLKQVVDSVSAGIWVFDGETIVLVNAAAERLTGYSRDELYGLGSLQLLLGPDGARTLLARARARLAGEDLPDRYELAIKTRDGAARQVELAAARIAFRGSPAVIISVFDVTERHQGEAALLASEARFRSLVDNSPDFITRVDRDLRHDFVNRTAEREAGLDPVNVLGKRADEIGFDPELARLFMARQKQVLDSGEPIEYEYAIRSLAQPQTVAYRRARVVPELDESGSVHHILSIVTDITAQREAEEARKRLNQQMQHAQKLESLGVLAGGIAHDFNNLLVAILGNAGLALMELTPESPARQTIQDIELAAQRAAELTRQMLAYSGKGRFVIEPLNLSRVVEEMAHLLEVSVSKRATVRYRFGEDLPTVEGDATQIRQVIMNLIMNASDALGEQSGVISISTGSTYADRAYLSSAIVDGDLPEGEYVYLEVADTGIGMDEETRARMFDPFFTTKFVGRGLGLAAVMGIVRGHRGAITLDSEPEKGTTFRVLFPASESQDRVETGEADTPDEAASGGRTILVVDDDATVRSVTRRILEHAGFRVLLAEDGREGLQVYAENPGIALVLLDMTMPLMDGAEAFQELRRMNPAVSVVLTSGYNEQDATESFAGKGLAGFIQKPYRPQELLTRVYEVIGEDGG